MRRRPRDMSPRFLEARFESVCPETGKTIHKGETCCWHPASRQAYHEDSQPARSLREIEFASAWNMADANY